MKLLSGSPGLSEYPLVLSDQFIEVNNLTLRKTELSESKGRPIYDRLPSSSERYKSWFNESPEVGYVLIREEISSTGPGSLLVSGIPGGNSLLVSGGETVWEFGTISHEPVYLDLGRLGINSSQYLIAYQMQHGKNEQSVYRDVKKEVITGIPLIVKSSSDDILGWRHNPNNVFTEDNNRVWKNYDPLFPNQPSEAFLDWQSEREIFVEELEVICPRPLDGPPSYAELWAEGQKVSYSQFAKDSHSYSFPISTPVVGKNWRIDWGGGSNIEVSGIEISGKLPSIYIPSTSVMMINLVVYPLHSQPTDNFVYCPLATFSTDDKGKLISEVQDLRNMVYNKYEPVADWLTLPWDDMIKEMYYKSSNYPDLFMDPRRAMLHNYLNLHHAGVGVG
jgi:hypothetical protein